MNIPIDDFIQACKDAQPNLQVTSNIFFKGIVALPLNREYLLQAYFIDNFREITKKNGELILYENPFPCEASNDGKIDLLFVTDENKIMVVETKYMSKESGRTACSKRTHHRKYVKEQIQKAFLKLTGIWGIDPDHIDRVAFTNDELLGSNQTCSDINYYYVSDEKLNDWRDTILNELL